MDQNDLREEIEIEFEWLEQTVSVVENALAELAGSEPTDFQKAGFGALLMNFYSGIENTLKRIAVYEKMPIPTGAQWHRELFDLLLAPMPSGKEPLLGKRLADLLSDYREFRHVVIHGYGVLLKWPLMLKNVRLLRSAFEQFKSEVENYLARV